MFDLDPADDAPWEEDDARTALVATVVLSEIIDKPLDYLVPEALLNDVEPGRRVLVPLGRGNRRVTGYCVEVGIQPTGGRRLKALAEVIDDRALVSPHMLRVTQWMAERYFCTWGQVLQAILPAGVRKSAGTRLVTRVRLDEGVVEALGDLKLSAKQRAVVQHLAQQAEPQTPADIAAALACSQAPITALRRKGILRSDVQRIRSDLPEEKPVAREAPHNLNPEQQKALDTILAVLERREHATLVMHGVTGSGKTEVYIRAIDEVVSYGRQAIVLVPEISLTPQTEARFRSRFDQVAVLHSHQSDAVRHAHWDRIVRGDVQVVVGPRSAIFAPTPHLGLIVIDEEHETTFKQESTPRYHAREVARRRAEIEGVPLVLGSATPSLETWHRAQQGTYGLISLPNRVENRPLPAVGTIDLRMEFRRRNSRGAVGRQLHIAITEALKAGGQVILLLNRRGYSTHIQCPACGEVVLCPECEIALTHHRVRDVAVCHYCNHERPTPRSCPKCNFVGIRHSGMGTQKLEAEIRARFPEATCQRMDTDSMQKPGSHAVALDRFRRGETQILLGTQMIAKGLDFPNVTLVGVINADTALHMPDFRAGERTFQLVTQVAGRTGRGPKGGRVLVQTYEPDHMAIRAAVLHDYEAFADGELPSRERRRFPPFTEVVRIVARGPLEATTKAFMDQIWEVIAKQIAANELDVHKLGPAAAPMPKLRGNYRYCLQLQSVDGEALRQAVREAAKTIREPDEIQWYIDVDAVDML